MRDVFNFTVKSVLGVCDLETLGFYITLMWLGLWLASELGMISQLSLKDVQLKLRFKVSREILHFQQMKMKTFNLFISV